MTNIKRNPENFIFQSSKSRILASLRQRKTFYYLACIKVENTQKLHNFKVSYTCWLKLSPVKTFHQS